MIDTIKLAKLRLSPINVRQRPDDQLQIPQLAADIAARGVLQNLLVTPAKKPRGTYEVFDGGRRLRALLLLAKQGVIDASAFDVPVKVLQGDDSTLTETSTAANFQQLRMTPAEECRAFHQFIGDSGDMDAVAKRFGVTRRFVEGRLRLATLAEPIFQALADGEITLDLAKAYASTENHDKQLLVWEKYDHRHVTADTVRRTITHEAMLAREPVALLVGAERYAAAGGKIDRDLFSEDGDRWIDPEIANHLAADIMETEAKRIGEETGLAWIRPIASAYPYNSSQGLHRVFLPQPELTDQQRSRLAAIDARRDELQEEMENEELAEGEWKALDEEDDRLAAEASAIENRAPILPDAYKPLIGTFLTLQPDGTMELHTTYFSEQPIRTPGDEADESDDAGEGDESGDSGFAGNPRGTHKSGEPEPSPDTVAPDGKALSARLYDELAMQRRDVLAAALLADPALALDYAIFCMIDQRSGHYETTGSTISADGPQDPISGDMPQTQARAYLAEAHDTLAADWTGHDDIIARFEAFRVLDDDSKAAWIAYIVAASLQAKNGYRNAQIPLHNRLATILDIEPAQWWRPTSENYFDRIGKSSLLALLNDIGGPALMARHATLKKSEISASCHKLFAGNSIVEPEVRERLLAWVPDAMRFADIPAAANDDSDDCTSNGSTNDHDLIAAVDEGEEAASTNEEFERDDEPVTA